MKVTQSFFSNVDTNLITDNKKFWKTVKPCFSEKHFSSNRITLLDGDKIISSDKEVAETFNLSFSEAVENLDVKGYENEDFIYNHEISPTSNIVHKFRNHPSILKIKEVVTVGELLHFSESSEHNIATKILSLNTKIPITFNNILAKLMVEPPT